MVKIIYTVLMLKMGKFFGNHHFPAQKLMIILKGAVDQPLYGTMETYISRHIWGMFTV